jgi:transcriptional regulator with XRE-family HTH domain
MPWNAARFVRIRKLKLVKQTELASSADVTQTRISECQAGQDPSLALLEKLADKLECTTDFLLNRTFHGADESDDSFREAVSLMAFDVFARRESTKDEQRHRCRRVLGHRSAPVTADGWATLAEQIDLAVSPTGDDRRLRAVNGKD